MELMDVEETLRSRPLVNSQGTRFPHDVPPRVHIPQIKLTPMQSAAEIFAPWYEECDQLVQLADLHDMRGRQFDRWYESQYLSNKPPGMAMGMLSPSRRE
ncbi:MVB12 (YGR206W) [Zygosaccharomyces parabailii]|uniref:BN860_07360g1_1 n=1 Tax=Zygosaccharomyces bailii (strain CLIB 213 / ATCC 58445 / CBS 680 / BCRC 21525 / NBRC 1098 / NCYC 1416 / NRRL Y-2227) TaxID=1333698 RepID=A0A8J2X537_ZYGB2|nr:MVB12 (YGR206W) [Zygosaccharomyces parabailii]CDF87482.1 BN860_07360g1_1 [Zygosaccharomyces bailii CLIB 213]CDH09370.1 related to Multivesicular body sorting factor 12 [Zygosaccharomyces bailii ISA1307]SJM85198.1 related to Multivesicular body sorting factor 12 [Zygosaccharomyces bailii]